MAKDIELPEKAWLWGTGVVSYDDAHYTPIVNPSWFSRLKNRIHRLGIASKTSFFSSFASFTGTIGVNVAAVPEVAHVVSPWLTLGIFGFFISGVGFSTWRSVLKGQKRRAIKAESQHVEALLSSAAGTRVIAGPKNIKQLVALYFKDNAKGPDYWKAKGITTTGSIVYKLEKAALEDGTPAYALAINGIPRQQISSNKALVHTFTALKDDKLDHHTATLVRVLQARAVTASELDLTVEQKHVIERVQVDAEEAVRLHVHLLSMTHGDDSAAVQNQRTESYEVLVSTLSSLDNQLKTILNEKQDEILIAAKTHASYVQSNQPKALGYSQDDGAPESNN